MSNSIQFHGKEIILNYEHGESLTFQMLESPKYEVGTEWIDFEDERYFLIKDSKK